MSQKRKPYLPKPKFNPVVQAKKIQEYKVDLEKLKQTIELINSTNEKHYDLLANFARHDMKNIIINMNSILELYKEEMPTDAIEAIQFNNSAMSTTLDNFQKLIPHSGTDVFEFNRLMSAIRILVSPLVDVVTEHGVIRCDMNDATEINLPFQAILQMVINVAMNAVTAVESNTGEKRIELSCRVENGSLFIEISDNGSEISPDHVEKIYDFKFSTTGGSGIGLNHAKYLCEKFKGEIYLRVNETEVLKKTFVIRIPIKS
ncbi:MAG TPA: HAMP domain-containing sensor histidine kinase [Sphingobacteriaceae bacterium]|nr:HAMP domain-containing sensor histidine kinase [Sphingobacteriaceae bacterium]